MSRARDLSRVTVDGADIIPFDDSTDFAEGTIGKALKDIVGVNAFDGMTPNASSTEAKAANLAALQANVTKAHTRGVPLIVPRRTPGEYRVNGSATVPDGGIDIVSDNGVIFSTADAPLFIFTGACEQHDIGGFRAVFELSAPPAAACAIKFGGADNTKFSQFNKIHNISSYGAIATIIDDSAPRTTSFGLESNVAWNCFDNISNFPFTNVARNVFWFKRGSGTGNTFTNTKGRLTSTATDAGASAYWRYEGGGHVVGDIVIESAHLLSIDAADCAAFEVMAGAAYRSNITLAGQTDAGVARVFRLNGQSFVDLHHDDGLIGGAAVLGIDAPLKTMRLYDRGIGEWAISGDWATDATTSTSIDVARVNLLGGFKGGLMLTVNVNGLVGGVANGVAEIKIAIRCDGAAAIAAVKDTIAEPTGIFGASVAISGLTATISLTMAPTGTGSNGHVNITGSGDNFSLERLL
ncbi:hypothetical protein [Sphingobium sp. TCM1]|uniref:hypothetical protein n=1 Tax=Sphingobium sp. TCM1 TaxID=453246 RepID=UPI0007F362E3|nr:hypothetical protein [Sphingobium sp. TCM1]OAN56918.1 hypothetical protein A7Q26_17635 [Sphingobium sp. TCM1]